MAGNFLLEINPGMAIIGELPNGQLGVAYSYQLKGVGGQGGYTFSTTGLVGTEFSLASDGTITSAGPTVPANIDFAVTMRDVLGRKVVREFTLRVIALPLSAAGSLGVFTYGAAYSDTLTVIGGVAPYSVTPLVKPSWLNVSMSSSTITLSAASAGSYSGSEVKLRVTDNVGAHIDVSYPFAWTTLTLTGTFADGTIGTPYSSDITIAGGNGNYSLTGGDGVTVGSLPTGLSLSIVGSSLRLSGTPTAAFTGSFTVGVDSGDGQSATSVQSPVIGQQTAPVYLPVALWDGTGYYRYKRITTSLDLDTWNPSSYLNFTDGGVIIDYDNDWVYGRYGNVHIYRYSIATGTRDTTFQPMSSGYTGKMLGLHTDGDIVFAVVNASVLGTAVDDAIVKVSPSGTLDTSYTVAIDKTGGNGQIHEGIPDGSGGFYIRGYYDIVDGTSRTGVTRINSSGNVDTSFADAGSGYFKANNDMMMAVAPDGKLWVANGKDKCVRFNTDGTTDLTITLPGGAASLTKTVAVDSQGRAYIGGNFSAYGGYTRHGIIRLNADGTLDTTFDASANSGISVYALMLQTDGRLFVSADSMTSIGGKARTQLAVIDTSTGLEISNWTTGPNVKPEIMVW